MAANAGRGSGDFGAVWTMMSRWPLPGTKVDICSHSHMFPDLPSGGLTPMAIRHRNTPDQAGGDSGSAVATATAGG